MRHDYSSIAPSTVPLRRKGKGTNRRNACFDWPSGTVGQLDWKTEKTRRPVSAEVLVWRGKHQPQAEQNARARKRKPIDWIGELPLPMMIEWLADVLKALHPDQRLIPLD